MIWFLLREIWDIVGMEKYQCMYCLHPFTNTSRVRGPNAGSLNVWHQYACPRLLCFHITCTLFSISALWLRCHMIISNLTLLVEYIFRPRSCPLVLKYIDMHHLFWRLKRRQIQMIISFPFCTTGSSSLSVDLSTCQLVNFRFLPEQSRFLLLTPPQLPGI